MCVESQNLRAFIFNDSLNLSGYWKVEAVSAVLAYVVKIKI